MTIQPIKVMVRHDEPTAEDRDTRTLRGLNVTIEETSIRPKKARFAMTPVVRVEIDAREHEPDLVRKFLQWQLAEACYPIRGAGFSGAGRCVAFFDACDADKVRAFFVEHSSIEFESQV
jgi:hypothetical protein